MSMRQKPDKDLKSYVACFIIERLQVPSCNESMALWVLFSGIKDRRIARFLGEFLAETMTDLMAWSIDI